MLAVFDIDGVVADVRHRLHHLDWPVSWRGFFAAAGRDPLLPEGASLVADLAGQHDIVWLTGRPEWLRDVTADWLARHWARAGHDITVLTVTRVAAGQEAATKVATSMLSLAEGTA